MRQQLPISFFVLVPYLFELKYYDILYVGNHF